MSSQFTPARAKTAAPVVTPDPCIVHGCQEPIAAGDLVYCAPHRVAADDGSLLGAAAIRPRLVQTGPNRWIEAEWARGLCLWCDQPTAPGDVMACAEHRLAINGMAQRALM